MQLQSSLDQSMPYSILSAAENFQISTSLNNFESNFADITLSIATAISSHLQLTAQDNIFISELLTLKESGTVAEISQEENLSIKHSTILLSDDDLEISTSIRNEEIRKSSNIENVISTPGNFNQLFVDTV